MKIVVLYGPPGAGKTAYARHNSAYGDVIIDQDMLYKCLTGLDLYEKPKNLFNLIENVRLNIIDLCSEFESKNTCWVLLSSKKLHDYVVGKHKNAKNIIFNTTKSQCYRNVSKDKNRDFFAWQGIIDKWFLKNA